MRKDVVKTLAALVTAAFGLVAALAWNSAIQELFRVFFGEQSGVLPMLIYALVVTVIAVIATLAIGRAASKAGVKGEDSAEVQELKGLREEVRSLRDALRRVSDTEAG